MESVMNKIVFNYEKLAKGFVLINFILVVLAFNYAIVYNIDTFDTIFFVVFTVMALFIYIKCNFISLPTMFGDLIALIIGLTLLLGVSF